MLFSICPAAALQSQNLNLAQAYAQAQAFNPGVRTATQKLTEALEKVRENVLASRPELLLAGNASLSYGNLPSPILSQSFYTYEGQLVLNLPDWAKNSAAVKAANIQYRIAALELNKTQLDLALQVETAYYGVLQNRDQENIAKQNLSQAQTQLSDTEKRVKAGDVPPADVLKAQVPELQAEAALASASSQYQQAKQTLNSLVGHPLGQNMTLAELAAQIPAAPTAVTPADLEKASPEIMEAQANVQAAQAALEIAKRTNDPQLALQASETHTSDPTTWTNLGSIGITLTVPLFDNGVLRQQLKELQLEVEQAKSSLTAIQQAEFLSAQAALAELKSAEQTDMIDQQVVKVAEESLTKARQAYEGGLTTTRDVLDAQIAAAQARSDANASRYGLTIAYAKLQRILGGRGF